MNGEQRIEWSIQGCKCSRLCWITEICSCGDLFSDGYHGKAWGSYKTTQNKDLEMTPFKPVTQNRFILLSQPGPSPRVTSFYYPTAKKI